MRYTNPRTHSLSLTHSPWRLVRSWRRSLRCGQVCRRSDNRPSPRRCITPGRTAGSSTTAGTPQARTLHATQFTGCFFVLVFFFYFTFFARQQSRLTSAFERTQIVYRVAETTLSVHSHYPCARMLLLNTRIYDPWTRVVLEPLCHVYTDCVVGRRRTSPLCMPQYAATCRPIEEPMGHRPSCTWSKKTGETRLYVHNSNPITRRCAVIGGKLKQSFSCTYRD